MNHYEVLGVHQEAEDIVIKASYRALSQKYHPDKNPDISAAARMTRINAAYAVLSNAEDRRRYDLTLGMRPAQEQSRERATPRPSTRAEKVVRSPLTMSEYLDACGVKKITSEHIFFRPSIPTKKLSSATGSYAHGVANDDVLILIDDTVFGSAKDGVIITADRIIFKEKFESPVSFAFSDIKEIACRDNSILINGRNVGSLALTDKLSTRYVFHEISSFLTARTRNQADSNRSSEGAADFDLQWMIPIFEKYMAPVPMKIGQDVSIFHGRRPGYHFGSNIPVALERTVRFKLGIAEQDRVLAVIDLWDGQGEAVAFTSRGIHSRCRASDTVTFFEWRSLLGRRVTAEFEVSVFNGIVLDDARRIICGRQNTILQPYGAALISELLGGLSNGWSGTANSANDLMTVLQASLQGFKASFDDDDEQSVDDDNLERIVMFFLDRQVTIVGQVLSIGVAGIRPEEFLRRMTHAQFLVMVLSLYSISLVPAENVVAMGREMYLGMAGMATSYFEYCRDMEMFAASLADDSSQLHDPELPNILVAALLSDDISLGSEDQRLDNRKRLVESTLRMEEFGLNESACRSLVSQAGALAKMWLQEVERFERDM